MKIIFRVFEKKSHLRSIFSYVCTKAVAIFVCCCSGTSALTPASPAAESTQPLELKGCCFFFLIGKSEILWKEYGLEFTLDCNCAISFQIRNKGIQAAGSQIRCHSCLFFLKVWGSSLTRHHESYK